MQTKKASLCEKISRRNSLFYSKRTNFLLHNLTLNIRDKEIAKEVEDVKTKRFSSLYFPTLINYCFLLLYRMIVDFSSEENEILKD
jgi:hypothetical protein